mmetsp:Transcript_34682/g.90799  ORF Transcript_34682/g.90799 Transcript_34682/m.90799 type:complete len:205 (+) Transcript_34682:4756-5370(+)
MLEAPRLEPVNRSCVDRYSLFCRCVWPVLEVVVLPLLLGLEVQPGEPAEVLLTHGLVNRGTAPNPLAVVVRRVGPPVCFRFDVAKNHVLDRRGQPRDLPRDVGLPAPPSLGQVLQDGPSLVLLDSLGHHVKDVVHYRRSQLKVKVRLDTLLGHRLGNPLVVPPFKLTGKQVAEPPFQERHDATEEEEPHAPSGGPNTDTRALSD